MMKRVRKGFTLVELLIVIAVLGSLSGMMMQASSDAVDSADAAKILSNLQSLKVAAMEMYIEEPLVAAKTSIAFNDATAVSDSDTRTIAQVLGAYLGKKADALAAEGAAAKYGLVGNTTHWYVVYKFDANDNAAVKAKLAAKAKEADLFGGSATTVAGIEGTDEAPADYYTDTVAEGSTAAVCVALKVR